MSITKNRKIKITSKLQSNKTKSFTFVLDQLLVGARGDRSEEGGRVGSVRVQSGGELHQWLHDALEMLQLFAGEEQPGAEEQVG